MVIAPARMGRERTSKKTVTRILQMNRFNSPIPFLFFMLLIVLMKLILPRMDEAPAMWSLKMVRSTDFPGWPEEDKVG
jgi:hypothetical protein